MKIGSIRNSSDLLVSGWGSGFGGTGSLVVDGSGAGLLAVVLMGLMVVVK